MRLSQLTIRDHRSVWGEPLTLPFGLGVTVLVGPNLAGKSNVVWALATALDPSIDRDPPRDRPVKRPDAVPEVAARFVGRRAGRDVHRDLIVRWPADGREEHTGSGGADGDAPVLPIGPGRVVLARAHDTVDAVVTRAGAVIDLTDATVREQLAACIREAIAQVIPEATTAAITLDESAPAGSRPTVRVTATDENGFPLSHGAGLRAAAAIGVAHHLALVGIDLAAVVIEEPEAFLHPAAQETMREALDAIAVETDTAVVITSESPFVVSRSPDARVHALARDRAGRTSVIASAHGDEPQAPLLGGLFRDTGFAAVLDRTSQLDPTLDGVLLVEGGTDEAYLRIAAGVLGREAELDRVAIHAAGGAMAVALQAIVFRAETDVPLLVLLDNDDPGRRAKDTLVSRFGFANRQQVTTYAEVIPDHPQGAEAEDVFDWRMVERFVTERGEIAIRGKRILRRDEWHFDLTSSAKSAFVGWLRDHATTADLDRWALILDLIAERLPPR